MLALFVGPSVAGDHVPGRGLMGAAIRCRGRSRGESPFRVGACLLGSVVGCGLICWGGVAHVRPVDVPFRWQSNFSVLNVRFSCDWVALFDEGERPRGKKSVTRYHSGTLGILAQIEARGGAWQAFH